MSQITGREVAAVVVQRVDGNLETQIYGTSSIKPGGDKQAIAAADHLRELLARIFTGGDALDLRA
jgi:hypothetical protein